MNGKRSHADGPGPLSGGADDGNEREASARRRAPLIVQKGQACNEQEAFACRRVPFIVRGGLDDNEREASARRGDPFIVHGGLDYNGREAFARRRAPFLVRRARMEMNGKPPRADGPRSLSTVCQDDNEGGISARRGDPFIVHGGLDHNERKAFARKWYLFIFWAGEDDNEREASVHRAPFIVHGGLDHNEREAFARRRVPSIVRCGQGLCNYHGNKHGCAREKQCDIRPARNAHRERAQPYQSAARKRIACSYPSTALVRCRRGIDWLAYSTWHGTGYHTSCSYCLAPNRYTLISICARLTSLLFAYTRLQWLSVKLITVFDADRSCWLPPSPAPQP